jgi:hypothetical protein
MLLLDISASFIPVAPKYPFSMAPLRETLEDGYSDGRFFFSRTLTAITTMQLIIIHMSYGAVNSLSRSEQAGICSYPDSA